MGQRECAHRAPARPRTPSPTDTQEWGSVSSGHAWLRSDHAGRISVLGWPPSSAGTVPMLWARMFSLHPGQAVVGQSLADHTWPIAGLLGWGDSLAAASWCAALSLWLGHLCSHTQPRAWHR